MTNTFNITHHFVNITEGLEETIMNICNEHIEHMSDSYLKKFMEKEDAELKLNITFEKNKQDKYEGKFMFTLDGQEIMYSNDVPFKEPLDVVNHAFKRLKEALSSK